MMRLTLVRHAHATSNGPQPSDYARPLSPRGESEASQLAQALLRSQWVPDCVVSSAAARARGTAEILVRELKVPGELRFEETLYLANAAQILSLAHAAAATCAHLMLIGHNPSMSELMQRLAPRGDLTELDTGVACCLSFETAAWAQVSAKTLREAHLEPRPTTHPAMWP